MDTARAILARGDCVVVFPEGTRVRGSGLGDPKRGIGRLALETGAPVAPVAVIGSDAVRRGWRIRPRKVRLRVGRPLRFPTVENCSPALAAGVTDRIWACVSLQWDWLGGEQAADAVLGEAPARREISRAA
jgi:1-acyl-sn-glycerol-3-phosphate acyltransferase